LYECLTGTLPFPGLSVTELPNLILNTEPERPIRRDPQTPYDLEIICLKCLSKEPGKRFQNAGDLADDLGRYCQARGVAEAVSLKARFADEQLARGDFAGAEMILKQAGEDLRGHPSLTLLLQRDEFHAKWDRVHQLVLFHRCAGEAFFKHGEERYAESVALAEQGLQALGVVTLERQFVPGWLEALPLRDLSPAQQTALYQDLYRLFMLIPMMRTMPWLNRASAAKPAEAGAAFRAARAVLKEAEMLERSEKVRPAQTVVLFGRFLDNLIDKGLAGLLSPAQQPPTDETGSTNPADSYFLAQIQYFLAKSPPDEMLAGVLVSIWADLDVENPWLAAEHLLATAAHEDPNQFWTHFALGRVLLHGDNFRGAAMSFDDCVRLRPEFSVSYQFRAQALARYVAGPAMAGASVKLRQAILNDVEKDSERAWELGKDEPAIFWARGATFAVLGRECDALEAYSLGLEADEQLSQKVSRRSVLTELREYLEKLIAANANNADAYAVRALVSLREQQPDVALTDADRALELCPGHVRAIRLRAAAVEMKGVVRAQA
jgi:tetratricopeptide (TPR) repeat protein